MPVLKTNDGAELYYEERGARSDRPSLVFIPGLTMSVPWFNAQLESLSDDYHCVCYDPRGQGRSEDVPYGHRTARWGRDLHDVLSALDIEDSIPVGWSLGGLVLLAYVDLYGSERTAGLVIVDSGTPETNRPGWAHGSGTEAENAKFAESMLDDMPKFATDLIGMMFHKEMPADYMREMAELTLQTPASIAYEITRDAMYTDYRDIMPNITVPTLLAVGGHGMIEPEPRAYMLERIPGSRLVVFEESGHSPFVEEPEEFNRALREFAAECTRHAAGAI
jgi:non-heme chloroperoxidase